MKTRIVIRIICPMLLALPLLLTSCQRHAASTPAQGEDVSQYLLTIAALESELQQQKESFYIKESAYKNEISHLQEQITVLVGKAEQDDADVVFHYRVENGEATITGYDGEASLLCIPSTLNGYPVVAIGERVFEGTSIAAVVIPEGVREVGWFAFYGCTDLINITLPASVTSIGYAVFDGCSHLSVYCPADSYAEQYARSYGLTCIIK